jgi:phosphatidylglycerophosphate synthase
MATRFTLDEVRAQTYKSRDAWWTVILVDPLASRLVQFVSRFRVITPNRLTMAAFLLGICAAACFAQQEYRWLVAGAVLFHLSFVIDCMDGKIARLTGSGSVFGAWLDYVFDRLRVLVCTIALMGGQYARTGNLMFLWAGGAVIFLDMFRYLNALQMSKVKNDMRAKIAESHGDGGVRPVFVEEVEMLHPVGLTTAAPGQGQSDKPIVDVYGDFRSRFSTFVRIRNFLVRGRIRAHVVSGIEFQMAVFIIGPVIGYVVQTTLVAGALLVAFELLLIFKLWTATRSYTGHLAGVDTPAQRIGGAEAAGPAPAAVLAPASASAPADPAESKPVAIPAQG